MLSSAPVADSIRDELDRLTRAYDLKDAVVANLSDQARALQKVPAAHGTKVDLVEKSAGDPKFNCYRFAFGLDQLTDAVASLVFDYGGKGIGKNFVRFILDDLTEVTAAGANDGDVVVYAKDEEITHAGILQDDRVLSKWGEGHLWLHPTFLVFSGG